MEVFATYQKFKKEQLKESAANRKLAYKFLLVIKKQERINKKAEATK